MIHTPTLLLISLAINLMSGLIMLFIHSLKPGRGNFLYWSLSAFLFSLSILLLSLGVLGGYPALGIRVGGLVSLMSILLLLAGFCALYERAWHPRAVRGGVAVLLLLYLGLSSLAPVRIVLALMESMLYLWCACLIVSLGRQQKRVLHVVALIYLLHFTILLSQGGLLLLGAEGRMGDGGWLDLIFFMHMVLTIGSVLLLPLVAYVETEEALLALSERDPLTGVLNRRGLFRQGEGAMPGQTRCVVVLDIDHFKRVNDQFGHGCGDEVIRYVAGVLVAEVRKDDLVGRIGGEEFAIIMGGVSGQMARDICDRIRRQIETGSRQGACLPCEGVTVSMGVVCASAEADLALMLTKADAAMYRVKEAGRNGVHLAFEPAPPRLIERSEG